MSVTIRKPTQAEIDEASTWKTWTKGITIFDMDYTKSERCLILEGDVKIITPEKNYYFQGGDYVIFKKGLKCKWVINYPVKKKYLFEDK